MFQNSLCLLRELALGKEKAQNKLQRHSYEMYESEAISEFLQIT